MLLIDCLGVVSWRVMGPLLPPGSGCMQSRILVIVDKDTHYF